MAFDLYIRFAGLCLLGRGTDALYALLPSTGHHDHGGHGAEVEPHVAVLGARGRYLADGDRSVRFWEQVLGDGAVEIEQLETDSGFEPDMSESGVIDLGEVTRVSADPDKARVSFVLGHGALCKPSECETIEGGKWQLDYGGYPHEVSMAPQATWRVTGVGNQVATADGSKVDGLVLRFKDLHGGSRSVALRAVDGRLSVFLIHAPADERPSRGAPPHRRPIKGDPETHFKAYYDLFPGAVETPTPLYWGDESETRHGLFRSALDYSCAAGTGPVGPRPMSGRSAPGPTPLQLEVVHRVVDAASMRADVERYAALGSRHVKRAGNLQAVEMLEADLRAIGNGLLVVDRIPFEFERTTLYNVVARLEAAAPESEVVIVSAHLDSTASREPGYQPFRDPAPGADDDGSGIACVLAAARYAVELAGPVKPRREMRFALFNAEEAKRSGSRAYADEAEQIARVVAVLQVDMIAHAGAGNGGFSIHAGVAEKEKVEICAAELAQVVADLSRTVSPSLQPQVHRSHDDATGAKRPEEGDGFSDHTTFLRRGIPAVLLSEAAIQGLDANPDYHLSDDTAAGLDFGYGASVARVVAAAAWRLATREAPPTSCPPLA